MANTKKKLKKLKRKVKELQKLNCYTESRLDKLELDVELLQANKADYDIMFEDLADNQHDMALNAMVKSLSEEELDEVFNEHNDEVGNDEWIEEDAIDRWNRQYQDELRNEYHSKFGDSGPCIPAKPHNDEFINKYGL